MAKSEKVRGNPKPVVKSTTIPTIKSSKTKRKSPPLAKAHLSSEFVQDSDDDEVPAATPGKTKEPVVRKKTPEKHFKAKAAAVEVSSDNESSSEESDESSSQKRKSSYEKVPKGVAKSDGESGSASYDKDKEDSSNDETTDSSSPTIPSPAKEKGLTTDSRQHQVIASTSHASETRPVRAFQPPHGFKYVNTPPTISKPTHLFPPQTTAEKQIWYITAPTHVPLSSLKELALDKVIEGEPVMTYKGVDYSFTTDDTARPMTSIILPSGVDFNALPTEVRKVVHLRQVVKLPTAPQSQARIPSTSTTMLPQFSVQKRTKREQPSGLRMRYRPPGAGTGDIGRIGCSDSDEPASSRPTLASSRSRVSKKRKEREDDTVPREKMKRKNDEHRKGTEDAMDSVTTSKEGSKRSKDSTTSFSSINGSAKANGNETPKKKDKEKTKKRDKGKA